jgi:hypothetical protein
VWCYRLRIAVAVALVLADVTAVRVTPSDAAGTRVSGPGHAAISGDTVAVSAARGSFAVAAGAATGVALRIGASAALVNTGTLDLAAVRRGATVVQQPPAGFTVPMATATVDATTAGALYGRDVGAALTAGTLVMGATSAGLRGARPGDVAELVGWNGHHLNVTIGAIVPDRRAADAELLLSSTTARALGFARPTQVVVFGFANRTTVLQALQTAGVGRYADLRPSWAAPDPDATVSQARIKAMLGEFSDQPAGSQLILGSAWMQRWLPPKRELLSSRVPIVARCNLAITKALRGALDDIARAGLASTIDLANTNTYGGCFGAREMRTVGGNVAHTLSRHAWGGAIDINTATNPLGARPTQDCRVVRIFRRWGFAWGGNWEVPDGMHFEWVGQRRDNVAYPSRYCPNR